MLVLMQSTDPDMNAYGSIPQKDIEQTSEMLSLLETEIQKYIVGQKHIVRGLIIGLLVKGHVLLEGAPGLAKTMIIKSIAQTIDASFSRIQFTPDLLPADITGGMMYRPEKTDFIIRRGPIFSNIVLADEINRAPAKVQAALLEAMEEGQVSIGTQTLILPDPFFVLASQNPIEQEGTYVLPEAELDRFVMKLTIGYPSEEEEMAIIKKHAIENPQRIQKVVSTNTILQVQRILEGIHVDDRVAQYAVQVVNLTRPSEHKQGLFARLIEFGASPRASLALIRCARVQAIYNKRNYVLPEDVKSVARSVLRHRIVLSYEAEAEGLSVDEILEKILASIALP